MRILILSGYWPTNANQITGIFVQQQVEEYVRQGHKITVIAPVPLGRPGRQRPLRLRYAGAEVWSPRFLALPGVPRLPLRLQALALPLMTRSFARSVLDVVGKGNLADKFDAIHANGIIFAGLSLPCLWRNSPLPCVITVHGDDHFLAPLQRYEPVRQGLSEMWKCASRVALVGTPLKRYAHALHAPEEKLVIVPNGTRVPTYGNAKSYKEKSGNKIFRLISVSNLNRKKGIHINIEAISILNRKYPDNNLLYTIIGDGPERKKLIQLAVNYNLVGNVRFVGRLPYDQTMELVGLADIFSLPSYEEAFGIVYIEAMARGIPVVGCVGTGAGDIIVDGKTGLLVRQRDANELARALERLVRDPALRRRIGRNARQKAKRFSWSSNVRNYVAIFKAARENS